MSLLVKSEDWKIAEEMGQRNHQQRNWSPLENDRRQLVSGQGRHSSGPKSNPASIQRERITMQDIGKFEATVGRCPGFNAIKDNKRAQAHSERRTVRVEECLRTTPQGAERLGRRSEVIIEALAAEFQRHGQRKERGSRVTTAAPHTAASASHELETQIEPDSNPGKGLLMKSASSAASGSG